MKQNNKGQIISALDVGSTKVVVAVAQCLPGGEVDLVALSEVKSQGVRQGQIVNMDSTISAILSAKESAEKMAGLPLSEIYLSVGGREVQTIDSSGMIPLKPHKHEIDKTDIDRVLEVARAIPLPEESHILHILPKSYRVDGQGGIDSPLAMTGVRLEVDAQIILGSGKSPGNLLACTGKAGLSVNQIVLDQYACSLATLEDEEKQTGVVLVGIGGGTCELIVYKDFIITHIGSIPLGGLNFTQDVAVGLKVPLDQAESIKKSHGTALVDMVGEEENIEVVSIGDKNVRKVPRIQLSRILEARAEETLSLISNQLNSWDALDKCGAGVVFTGGCSQLKGFIELAEFAFDIPVRQAKIRDQIGLKEDYNRPSFMTVLGTLLLACGQNQNLTFDGKTKRKVLSEPKGTWNQIKKLMTKALSI